jgi:uncharacterized protein DUF1877
MGMIGSVLGVTSAQMHALRAKPALVSELTLVAAIDVTRSHPDELTQYMSQEQRAQFEASAAAARAAIADLGPLEKALKLEKSWHMLHYLFTGHVGTWHPGELLPSGTIPGEDAVYGPSRLYDDSHAPGDLILSGEETGPNMGYGFARLHDERKTSEFSRFLDGQDLARLRARTDFAAMNRAGVLYGAGDPSDEALKQMLHEEIALYFQLLRAYVRAMADKGNGLMVWIS